MRDFVLSCDTMLRVAAEHAAGTGDDCLLLELGAETGALSEAILTHGSFRATESIDIDPETLEHSPSRLVRYGDKFRFEVPTLSLCRPATSSRHCLPLNMSRQWI